MSDTLLYLSIAFDGDPVPGESVAERFENQIEIDDFRWGMSVKGNRKQTTGPAAQARQAANVAHKNLVLSAFFDTATTALIKCMTQRKKFRLARLTVAHPVNSEERRRKVDVMEIELRQGYVEKVNINASESGKSGSLKVSYELSYTGVGLNYHPATKNRNVHESLITFSAQVSSSEDD
ncbi:MAG TPA: type VI secretion system tube protein Hcp [Ideonella sp.]|nr:type VI secretion system tube protein Hcp [Ideonella sp.]